MRDPALPDIRPGPPPTLDGGRPGGDEFSNPGLGGPLSCLPNDNSTNWRSKPPSGLEGPEGASSIGVPPKGEDPNSRPGAVPLRVPMGMEKWTSSVVTGEITWLQYSTMTS